MCIYVRACRSIPVSRDVSRYLAVIGAKSRARCVQVASETESGQTENGGKQRDARNVTLGRDEREREREAME